MTATDQRINVRPQGLSGHRSRNGWTTPRDLFDRLNLEFGFTHDAACTPENALAKPIGDGLRDEWSGVVWCNPPYDETLGLWVRKAWESAQAGTTSVLLVPVRTSVAWWHEYAMRAQIRFLRGRLKFGDARVSAPFDSAILVFYPPLISMRAER